MIEVIYKEEKEAGQETIVHLPKNIRQIGLPCGHCRIYMEDYVNTFLKKMSDEAIRAAGAAMLLGQVEFMEGVTYIFIRCAYKIEEKITLEHISFTEETWNRIREGIDHYFPSQEIVGWFFTAAGLPMAVENALYRVHMTYFSGADKVLYLMEAQDKEEAFFQYDNGQMCRQSGYYVYYEQNPLMQNYMIDQNHNQSIESETDVKDTAVKSFRKMLQGIGEEDEDEDEEIEKGGGWFSIAATAALAIAVLVAGSSFLGNYQKMKAMQEQLKSAASELASSQKVTTEDVGEGKTGSNISVTQKAATGTPTLTLTPTPTIEKKMMRQNEKTQETSGSELRTYTVEEGDSLTSIALEFYGDIDMVDEICELNEISEPETIYEGEIIVLP